MNTTIKKTILISILLGFLLAVNHYLNNYNIFLLGILVYYSAYSHLKLFILLLNSKDDETAVDLLDSIICLFLVNLYIIYLTFKACGFIAIGISIIVAVTSIYGNIEYIEFIYRDQDNDETENNNNEQK